MMNIETDFGVNTNLIETNVLNLSVVLRIVITIVGDALRSLLDQRRRVILSTLQEADQKWRRAKHRMRDSQKAVEAARTRAHEILAQAARTVENEKRSLDHQLKDDIQRLEDRRSQAISLERNRAVQFIARRVIRLALADVKTTLLTDFGTGGLPNSKQRDLIDMHLRDTLNQMYELFVSNYFAVHYKLYKNIYNI